MKCLVFNFYQYKIKINSDLEGLLKDLAEDFSYFLSSTATNDPVLELNIKNQKAPKIPVGLLAKSQSFNSIRYTQNDLTYFDFYGKVLQIENVKYKTSVFYGEDEARLYEVVYLYILSLSGKDLDLHHLHKIHAASVLVDNKIIINMMPMKGGKSTWLLHMIKKFPQLQMISDDTPLVDIDGNVLVFPTRMAVDLETYQKVGLNVPNLRSFKREQYGEKVLIDYAALNIKVAKNSDLKIKKIILLDSHRISGDVPTIKKIGKIATLTSLMRHMVIGVGLPIIAEYFVRFNLIDFIKLSFIFYCRLWAAIRLILKADAYRVGMSNDIGKNIQLLKSELNLHIDGA
jgi:hypothetical protein